MNAESPQRRPGCLPKAGKARSVPATETPIRSRTGRERSDAPAMSLATLQHRWARSRRQIVV